MGCRVFFTILNPLLVLLLALCTKGCVETERLALLDFKASFTSSSQNQGKLSSWKNSSECCSWEGIACDNHSEHVLSLDLFEEGLESNRLLQPSVVELQHLRRLDLSYNFLIVMRIPEFVGSLGKLIYLDLSECGLFGMIPPQHGNLSNLQTLSLGIDNSVFSTNNFQWLSHLSSLENIYMSSVNFSEARDCLSVIINLPFLSEFSCWPCHFPTDPYFSSHVNSSSSLKTLVLSSSNLSSILQTLFPGGNSQLSTNNFHRISHLSSLENIQMFSVDFSEARDCLSAIINLPSLSEFDCQSCYFPTDPYLSSHVNSSSSLQTLYLSSNNLSSTVLSLLINCTNNLKDLSLSGLNLEVPFPNIFHDMTSLETLDISYNQLEDGIFNSIGNLCNLKELYASGCIMKESLANLLHALSPCASNSLEWIDFSSMNLTGSIPPMLNFQSLMILALINNSLDSLLNTLPLFPANLISLSLGNNTLHGVLSDVHFTNLSQLHDLSLSNNPNLTVRFNKPPAGANVFRLRFCNLGPSFPSWILAVGSISELDISHCMISGTIPIMFWRNLSPLLQYLNLSFNRLYGIVPNIQFQFFNPDSRIYLSSNAFCGPIPYVFFSANVLNLSNNNFSGFAPIPHPYNFSSFFTQINFVWDVPIPSIVDLSNNLLSGPVPHWLMFKKSLTALILAYNNLSGTIPSSIGQAVNLYVLTLRNKNFSGPLPSLLKNCSQLRILDLSGNHFSGFIPSWMGENLKYLSILSLGSNSFMGILPTGLCHLSSLQILDLSHNFLLGSIPSCVYDFSAMAHDVDSSLKVINFDEVVSEIGVSIEDASYYNAYIRWKSKVWKFHSTLHLVKLIDLSSNNLSGEIPTGLASLVELDSINLSCNSLHGSIPEQIGKLKSLQYLNLSSNRLCGQIPQSLSEIYALEMLDLSHNNLFGRIPKATQLQTFDPSAFAENPDLCSQPLSMCPGDRENSAAETPPTNESGMEEKWGDKECFYAGSGAGFACSFFEILSTLIWIREWRYAFFRFASEFGEWILLVLALSKSKISRKLGFK